MSFLGDIFSFEAFNAGEMFKKAKKNPEQLLLGAADPFSAKMWSGITGKNYEPIVNQWGGAADDVYAKAEAKGINTGPGRTAHSVAQSIAGMYAGGAGMKALGAGGNAASGATNQWGMPQGLQTAFEQSQQPQWLKYLDMLGDNKSLLSPKQEEQRQAYVMPTPQARQIQTSQAQNGVGYRKPIITRKGLLG